MATKSIAFVFALFAIAALVTACSGGDAASEPSTESAGGDAPAEQAAVVIDDAIVDESDDVEIGELI